jgi:hypothetical protein
MSSPSLMLCNLDLDESAISSSLHVMTNVSLHVIIAIFNGSIASRLEAPLQRSQSPLHALEGAILFPALSHDCLLPRLGHLFLGGLRFHLRCHRRATGHRERAGSYHGEHKTRGISLRKSERAIHHRRDLVEVYVLARWGGHNFAGLVPGQTQSEERQGLFCGGLGFFFGDRLCHEYAISSHQNFVLFALVRVMNNRSRCFRAIVGSLEHLYCFSFPFSNG